MKATTPYLKLDGKKMNKKEFLEAFCLNEKELNKKDRKQEDFKNKGNN